MTEEFYEITTSNRNFFKRCRRKWYFQSPMGRHLVPKDERPNIHLWFGTGFHFALEDYHGYNLFGDPVLALEAYFHAFRESERPEEAEDIIALGMGMFEHYKRWLSRRDLYQTVWLDGKPLLETRFALELTEVKADKPVIYRGTIDRIVENEYKEWFTQDYKTAASIDWNKMANDPQISTYVWAAEQYYQREVVGMVYSQFAKKTPQPPAPLKTGGISANKQQKTTHSLYREALLELYPDGDFPDKNVECLNHFASLETVEGDEYIRSDVVTRNQYAKEATYRSIVAEAQEMVNPDTVMYPNPTRDCAWDCDFRSVCLMMDEGDDWEEYIEQNYKRKEEHHSDESWRKRIKWPNGNTESETSDGDSFRISSSKG